MHHVFFIVIRLKNSYKLFFSNIGRGVLFHRLINLIESLGPSINSKSTCYPVSQTRIAELDEIIDLQAAEKNVFGISYLTEGIF